MSLITHFSCAHRERVSHPLILQKIVLAYVLFNKHRQYQKFFQANQPAARASTSSSCPEPAEGPSLPEDKLDGAFAKKTAAAKASPSSVSFLSFLISFEALHNEF